MYWQVMLLGLMVVSVTTEICDEKLATVRYHGPDDDIAISPSTGEQNQMSDFAEAGRRILSLLRKTYKKSLTSKNFPSTFQGKNRYIQVDLGRSSLIRAIISRGCGQNVNGGCGRHVTKYRLLYSLDGTEWHVYNAPGTEGNAIFVGDNGPSASTTYHLKCPLIARYVRIFPITLHLPFHLTLDINGCFLSTDKKMETPETTTDIMVTDIEPSSSLSTQAMSSSSEITDSTGVPTSTDNNLTTEPVSETTNTTGSHDPMSTVPEVTVTDGIAISSTEISPSEQSSTVSSTEISPSEQSSTVSSTESSTSAQPSTVSSTEIHSSEQYSTVSDQELTTQATTESESTTIESTALTNETDRTRLPTTEEVTSFGTSPSTPEHMTLADTTTVGQDESTPIQPSSPEAQENTIDPSPVNGCVEDCIGKADGHYHSCKSCKLFVTCSNGILFDKRPCPSSLVWDDIRKQCSYNSQTCASSQSQDPAKQQQQQQQQQREFV